MSWPFCRLAWFGQWNGFVNVLPLWLAPNMVTLLGFCFILVNVLFLRIWMPDLVGPVSGVFAYYFKSREHAPTLFWAFCLRQRTHVSERWS